MKVSWNDLEVDGCFEEACRHLRLLKAEPRRDSNLFSWVCENLAWLFLTCWRVDMPAFANADFLGQEGDLSSSFTVLTSVMVVKRPQRWLGELHGSISAPPPPAS